METTPLHTTTTRLADSLANQLLKRSFNAHKDVREEEEVPEKTVFQTYMWQLCAAKLGLAELVYKDPIVTEDEEFNGNKEESHKDKKMHNNQLNRKTEPLSNDNATVPSSNGNATK
eukprot:11872701-Ditylum_brightwellii.AAC.1